MHKNKYITSLIFQCACGQCILSSLLHSGNFVRSSLRSPCISFCFHSMLTPQHRTASAVSFLFIPQAPLIQSVTIQAISQPTTMVCIYFLRRVWPQNAWRQSGKQLHLNGGVIRRTANPKYCPENHLWLLCLFTFRWKHKSHNRFSNGDIGHNPFFLAWHFETRYPLKKMRCDRVW